MVRLLGSPSHEHTFRGTPFGSRPQFHLLIGGILDIVAMIPVKLIVPSLLMPIYWGLHWFKPMETSLALDFHKDLGMKSEQWAYRFYTSEAGSSTSGSAKEKRIHALVKILGALQELSSSWKYYLLFLSAVQLLYLLPTHTFELARASRYSPLKSFI